jgi:predicted enzyme related to lactoylglutathione lyase
MTLKLANITFDCENTIAQADFWSAALGLATKVGASEFFAALDGGPGGPNVFFSKVPEGKTAKNRMHIDLESDDRQREIERLITLGANHVADKDEWGIQWTVLHDPEGNEFCVSGPHP